MKNIEETLKDYGISSYEELLEAIRESEGIDIGVMVNEKNEGVTARNTLSA